MSLSRREEEDLLYMIDKAVYKFIGNEDSDLAKSALNCIVKGYDRRKTESKKELRCFVITFQNLMSFHCFSILKLSYWGIIFFIYRKTEQVSRG